MNWDRTNVYGTTAEERPDINDSPSASPFSKRKLITKLTSTSSYP
jgi:hypothetical protein